MPTPYEIAEDAFLSTVHDGLPDEDWLPPTGDERFEAIVTRAFGEDWDELFEDAYMNAEETLDEVSPGERSAVMAELRGNVARVKSGLRPGKF